MTSMLPRPPAHMPPHDVLTSALTRLPTVPGSVPMQRPAARVDDCNVYTHGIEQLLLPELPQPPPVHRQMPLLSDNKQTTASDYVNQDPVPVLTAHRYADIPFDSINYQNISPNLSLPTHDNVPTHICVSLSQPIALGQSNVTQPSALYAASYTSNPSSMVAFQSSVCTSQADNSQRLPIAVGQPALSAFSRVDAPKNRPIAVDPTVQYTVGTSVSSSSAPLQSPSVHWRKRLAYDYVQPDTGLGAPIHAAPAIRSGYIRPQISDTQTSVHLQTVSFGGHLMSSVGLPPRPPPPPSFYVPHGHIMPPQVPTVPSVVPPPSHLPFQVPISSSSETNVTYLHVPQTHTVFADVHAPFTHESLDASASACIVSSQPQSTAVTTQSHSVLHTQSVPNSAVNFNALPTGWIATADTVVPPPTAMPPPMPPTNVHSTPVVTVPQSFLQSVPTFIVKQPQMPKPYSGATNYQSFKEH